MLVDLHVHAGAHGLAFDDLIRRALEIGLDGVALLGDDTIPDLSLAAANEHLRLFAGAEVATDRGHYIVFLPRPRELPPLSELFGPPPETRWPVRDVLARTAALGGAVIASRPYDTTVDHPGGDILYTLGGLTAVEVVAPLHPREIAYPAIEAAECLGLPCVGGSGARGSAEDLGKGATLFTHVLQDEVELIAALRSGSCWPVEFGAPPSQVVRHEASPHGRAPHNHRREAPSSTTGR
jgi:predicted metal-dependent phosphoesterase TrpH